MKYLQTGALRPQNGDVNNGSPEEFRNKMTKYNVTAASLCWKIPTMTHCCSASVLHSNLKFDDRNDQGNLLKMVLKCILCVSGFESGPWQRSRAVLKLI